MIFSFTIHKTFLKDFPNPMYFYPYKMYYTIIFSNIGIFSPETEWKTAVFSRKKKSLPEKYTFLEKNIWRTVTLTEKINHPIL